MDKSFQRKWDDVAESSQKILNTNPICSSNHNPSDSSLNGFQLVKNRNGTASTGGEINRGFASDWDNDWGNGNGAAAAAAAASGATSIAMQQRTMIESDEKSTAIENHCDGATSLIANTTSRYNRYKMGNKRSAAEQPWSNGRQRQNSNRIFERIRSMKTQCETTSQLNLKIVAHLLLHHLIIIVFPSLHSSAEQPFKIE